MDEVETGSGTGEGVEEGSGGPVTGYRSVADAARLREGDLVITDGRVWRVGLVNVSRARLDPLNPTMVADTASGRVRQTYGNSINISPTALIRHVTAAEANLDEMALARLARMEREATTRKQEEEDTMPEVNETTQDAAAARKAQNMARLAALKEQRKAEATKERQTRTVTNAKERGLALNDCKCGCGNKTRKFFVPGHDATFKALLTKIERGDADVTDLPQSVQTQYKWVKSEHGGKRPTTNYRGEPHNGYIHGIMAGSAAAKAARAKVGADEPKPRAKKPKVAALKLPK